MGADGLTRRDKIVLAVCAYFIAQAIVVWRYEHKE